MRYFQSIKKPLTGPDGSRRILVIAHDITELQLAHRAIEESEKSYKYAMDASHAGMWDWDIVNGTVSHNAKWCELLGLDENMRVHRFEELTQYIHPEDRDKIHQGIQNALSGDGQYSSEHRMIRQDGEEIWVYDRGRVVERSESGEPLRLVGSFSNITLRKLVETQLEATSQELARSNERLEQLVEVRTRALWVANAELERIANHDQLTGLGNRTMYEQWLASRSRNDALMVMLIDLDHFKSINDRFGHKFGDHALCGAAECFAKLIREEDLLVRWGGEEFLVVLNQCNEEQALQVAEKLRSGLENISVLPNHEKVTASIGVCTSAASKNDIEQALHHADQALYRAKAAGRNQVKFEKIST